MSFSHPTGALETVVPPVPRGFQAFQTYTSKTLLQQVAVVPKSGKKSFSQGGFPLGCWVTGHRAASRSTSFKLWGCCRHFCLNWQGATGHLVHSVPVSASPAVQAARPPHFTNRGTSPPAPMVSDPSFELHPKTLFEAQAARQHVSGFGQGTPLGDTTLSFFHNVKLCD